MPFDPDTPKNNPAIQNSETMPIAPRNGPGLRDRPPYSALRAKASDRINKATGIAVVEPHVGASVADQSLGKPQMAMVAHGIAILYLLARR